MEREPSTPTTPWRPTIPERATPSGRATDPFERERPAPAPRGFLAVLREFLYGMAGYEFARQAVEMRTALETVFMVTVVGDMVGLPVLPPYYSLRLLPYVTPEIATWRRRVLRDRELVDTHEFHLHGV